MKLTAQILVIRALGTFVLGTFLLILGAIILPDVFKDLPRLLLIAAFYGGGYALTWLFTTPNETEDGAGA